MIAEKVDRGTTSSNTATRIPLGSPRRSGVSMPNGASVRYATGQTLTMPRIVEQPERSAKTRTKAKARHSAFPVSRLQGDSRMIAYLVTCFVVVVALGTIYLSAYARVSSQGRQLDSLRKSIAAETARQHGLVFEIGQAESPATVAAGAARLGMVMGDRADYVTVHGNVKTASDSGTDTPANALRGTGLGYN